MVKKNTEEFLGSYLHCCLHTTVLLAVKYSAELNKYRGVTLAYLLTLSVTVSHLVLVRVICEKYRFRG